jgi:hypothetical protein
VIDPRTPSGRKLSRPERIALFITGLCLLLAGYVLIVLGTP